MADDRNHEEWLRRSLAGGSGPFNPGAGLDFGGAAQDRVLTAPGAAGGPGFDPTGGQSAVQQPPLQGLAPMHQQPIAMPAPTPQTQQMSFQRYQQTSPYGHFGSGTNTPFMGGFADSLNTMSGLGGLVGGAFAGVNQLNAQLAPERMRTERLQMLLPLLRQSMSGNMSMGGGGMTGYQSNTGNYAYL